MSQKRQQNSCCSCFRWFRWTLVIIIILLGLLFGDEVIAKEKAAGKESCNAPDPCQENDQNCKKLVNRVTEVRDELTTEKRARARDQKSYTSRAKRLMSLLEDKSMIVHELSRLYENTLSYFGQETNKLKADIEARAQEQQRLQKISNAEQTSLLGFMIVTDQKQRLINNQSTYLELIKKDRDQLHEKLEETNQLLNLAQKDENLLNYTALKSYFARTEEAQKILNLATTFIDNNQNPDYKKMLHDLVQNAVQASSDLHFDASPNKQKQLLEAQRLYSELFVSNDLLATVFEVDKTVARKLLMTELEYMAREKDADYYDGENYFNYANEEVFYYYAPSPDISGDPKTFHLKTLIRTMLRYMSQTLFDCTVVETQPQSENLS